MAVLLWAFGAMPETSTPPAVSPYRLTVFPEDLVLEALRPGGRPSLIVQALRATMAWRALIVDMLSDA